MDKKDLHYTLLLLKLEELIKEINEDKHLHYTLLLLKLL